MTPVCGAPEAARTMPLIRPGPWAAALLAHANEAVSQTTMHDSVSNALFMFKMPEFFVKFPGSGGGQ